MADKPHGHGTMKYADQSEYEGQFYHGLRQGQGTYTHVTGKLLSPVADSY